jgi:hypothetical protein
VKKGRRRKEEEDKHHQKKRRRELCVPHRCCPSKRMIRHVASFSKVDRICFFT